MENLSNKVKDKRMLHDLKNQNTNVQRLIRNIKVTKSEKPK